MISAKGMIASQLPELPEWLESTIKQYPYQPVLKDDNGDKGIVASRTEKVTMIPNQAGEYIVPEISISWWNTKFDRQEVASIPARKIHVVSSTAVISTGFSNPFYESLGSIEISDTENVSGDIMLDNPPNPGNQVRQAEQVWQVISLVLLVIWLVTVALWLRSRNNVSSTTQGEQNSANSLRAVIKDLKLACESNEPAMAKDALLRWARLSWKEKSPSSISEIATRSNEALTKEIYLISSVLYSNHRRVWHGDSFWQAFSEEKKLMDKKDDINHGKLKPLYKI